MDDAAEQEVALLQRVVTEVRRFRSDQGLRPGQRVAARLDGLADAGLAPHEPLIRSLARLDEPGRELRGHRDAVRRRRGRRRAGHPGHDRRGGGAGPAGKDRAAAEKEAAQCRAKLGNPAFTARRPTQVVDEDPGPAGAAESRGCPDDVASSRSLLRAAGATRVRTCDDHVTSSR